MLRELWATLCAGGEDEVKCDGEFLEKGVRHCYRRGGDGLPQSKRLLVVEVVVERESMPLRAQRGEARRGEARSKLREVWNYLWLAW